MLCRFSHRNNMCRQEERKPDKNLTSHFGEARKSNTNVLNKAFRKDAGTLLHTSLQQIHLRCKDQTPPHLKAPPIFNWSLSQLSTDTNQKYLFYTYFKMRQPSEIIFTIIQMLKIFVTSNVSLQLVHTSEIKS